MHLLSFSVDGPMVWGQPPFPSAPPRLPSAMQAGVFDRTCLLFAAQSYPEAIPYAGMGRAIASSFDYFFVSRSAVTSLQPTHIPAQQKGPLEGVKRGRAVFSRR